jgi:hypothetical protein
LLKVDTNAEMARLVLRTDVRPSGIRADAFGPPTSDYDDNGLDETERILSGFLTVSGLLVAIAATAAGVVIFALCGAVRVLFN